jgi:hypothetical protein
MTKNPGATDSEVLLQTNAPICSSANKTRNLTNMELPQELEKYIVE